jgi:thioredoxin-dependent peroxiredoxin
MATITLKGKQTHTVGSLPAIGSIAPDFKFTKTDLSDEALKTFAGKRIVLNIFPSLDTSVCAASVRKFNVEAAKLKNTVILAISKDTPFAHKRFCTTEGIENVIPASLIRNDKFGTEYGVQMADGGMAGLMSRAVIVLDEHGKVIYTEQVPEIGQEPDYEKALKVLA